MSAVPSNIAALPSRLEDLVDQYIAAKKEEELSKMHRLAIEERILALAPAKEEGSETTALSNGFKVTTTGSLRYKADDIEALRAITAKWDANLVPLKTATMLDETGCKFLRRERPELWAQLARVVTTAPAKTAIKIGV